jgi:hypothetical protein
MWDDPIVAEVRRIRAEHAARFRNDLEAIYRDLREREKNSGRTYVRFSPRACRVLPDGSPRCNIQPAEEVRRGGP